MSEGEKSRGFEDPRRVLGRHGLSPKKRFSQNFLVARSVVERIAAATVEGAPAHVVELGPGVGTLTVALLDAGTRVHAIEKDAAMIDVLREELGDHPGFEVREGDAASVDYDALAMELGGPLTIVGNLPYAITGPILKNMSAHRAAIRTAVLMVQREVRDRLVAEPGTKAYGALTVFTQAAFDVTRVLNVTRGSFHPAPKVDSAVFRLTPPKEQRAMETPALRSVVKASFEARRKTLRNALKRIADSGAVDAALTETGIDGRRRGETLSVEEFARLADTLTRTSTIT